MLMSTDECRLKEDGDKLPLSYTIQAIKEA